MDNWFQSDKAERLLEATEGEMTPVRISTEHCSCLVVFMGPWWAKRAIVQGGVRILSSSSVSENLKDELRELLMQVRSLCRRRFAVYVEMRNFADYSAFRSVFEEGGFVYCPHYDVIIPLPAVSATSDAVILEHLFSMLHESKQRMLRKALADGQTWREAQSEEDIKAFYPILYRLYHTKIHRPLPSCNFFIQAWRSGIKVLVTELKNQIVGGVLMPVYQLNNEQNTQSHSNNTPQTSYVAYEWYICGGILSTWAMMEWGIRHGIHYIDMMGAGEPDVPYGVRDFKLQMGGKLYEWGRFRFTIRPIAYNIGRHLFDTCKRALMVGFPSPKWYNL